MIKSFIDTLEQNTLADLRSCELSVASVIAGYPVLYEGLPGVGKTGLAVTLSKLLGLVSRRLQCTPDIQPADIVGYLRPNAQGDEFIMVEGPVFTPCLLVDEINRANPRAQSALLEAMAEGTVTLEGVTHTLPEERVILATQNPQDQIGTHPLPESQLDRFGLVLPLVYPSAEKEARLLQGQFTHQALSQQLDLMTTRKTVLKLTLNDACLDYLQRLVSRTREHPDYVHGLSTRGAKVLADIARAMAFIRGRDFVTPDDIQAVFFDVARHRLALRSKSSGFTPDAELQSLLESVSL